MNRFDFLLHSGLSGHASGELKMVHALALFVVLLLLRSRSVRLL